MERVNTLELHKRKIMQEVTSYSRDCPLLPLDHFSEPSVLRESHLAYCEPRERSRFFSTSNTKQFFFPKLQNKAHSFF